MKAKSINELLGDDAVQYILAFNNDDRSNTRVCKAWQISFNKNEINLLRKIHTPWKNHKNRIIIVDQKRPKLHELEKRLEFLGPYDLLKAMQMHKSGDKILFRNGHYKMPAGYDFNDINIIGIESNVILELVSNSDIGVHVNCTGK